MGKSRLSYEQFRALDARSWGAQLESEVNDARASIERREEELRIHGPKLEPWHRECLKQQLLKERVRYAHAYIGRAILFDTAATVLFQRFLDRRHGLDSSSWPQSVEQLSAHRELAGLWSDFADRFAPIALARLEAHMRHDLRSPILRLVPTLAAG